MQVKVAPFYRAQVRSLDPAVDVMTTIDPVKPVAQPSEPTKSGINVSIKWETLTPEEKQALMAKMDINDQNPPPAVAPNAKGSGGSSAKLGEAAPNTPFSSQLTQQVNKK